MTSNINLCVLDSLEAATLGEYTEQVVKSDLYNIQDDDFLNFIRHYVVSGCDHNGDHSVTLTKEDLKKGGELTIKVNERLFDIKVNKVGALTIRAY